MNQLSPLFCTQLSLLSFQHSASYPWLRFLFQTESVVNKDLIKMSRLLFSSKGMQMNRNGYLIINSNFLLVIILLSHQSCSKKKTKLPKKLKKAINQYLLVLINLLFVALSIKCLINIILKLFIVVLKVQYRLAKRFLKVMKTNMIMKVLIPF